LLMKGATMSDSSQAIAVLKAADATERRSAEVYWYSRSAPHFFIWGVAWMIGYFGCALKSDLFDVIMPVAIWSGIAGSLIVSLTGRKSRNYNTWRIGAAFLVMWIFTYGLFAIFPPDHLKIGAYFPWLFAALYGGVGLWLGLRYVIAAAFLAGATLAGYFHLRDYFFLWMAIVGGGCLILTGFWLRRA
jgi:hypothetical protein